MLDLIPEILRFIFVEGILVLHLTKLPDVGGVQC